jgi:Chlorophyll A-B binding protein
MRTKEINNGRLAMIATAGFVAQELVNYKAIVPTLEEKLGTGAVAPRL